MHPKVVVDASVLVSQASNREVYHKESNDWVTRYLSNDGLIVEPALVLVEVAAALSRRTGQTLFAEEAARALRHSPTISVARLNDALIDEAVRLAANLRLRAGDAIYVALAHQLGLPLVSWDKEQLQRASSLIETYTPISYPF